MKGKRRKSATPFKSLIRGLELRPQEVVSSDWEAWSAALAELDPRDRLILEGRYGLAERPRQTLQALGAQIGITHERVRQLQKRALGRLRRRAAERRLVREEALDRLSPYWRAPFLHWALIKRKARVLVVDNDRTFLDAIEPRLRQAGFECALVESIREAEAECDRTVPDAVVLELKLREGEGYRLFRALRANFRTKDVPVVFMAGGSDMDTDLLATAGSIVGAFAFLRKPVDLDQATRMLKAAVGLPLDYEEQLIRLPTIVNGPELQIDVTTCKLFVEGRVERLEPKERDVLLTLIRHPGRLWPADFLRRQVWGTPDPGRNTLQTRISALRRKLGGLRSRLRNVPRRGYRFAA